MPQSIKKKIEKKPVFRLERSARSPRLSSRVMIVVMAVASRVRDIITLLVIGLMTGYVASAMSSFLIAFSQQVALGLEKILLLEKVNQRERPLPAVKPIAPRQRERITFELMLGGALVFVSTFLVTYYEERVRLRKAALARPSDSKGFEKSNYSGKDFS
jgi:hypothetical protein